jgi:DHA1 family tetracycline resistance protein-like MFS transporter
MSIAWPSAQSIMSHHIGPSEQGQLQGAVNSLRGIAGLLGPGLFTYIFSKSIGLSAPIQLPGMPFFVASGMLIAALGLMVVIRQTKTA